MSKLEFIAISLRILAIYIVIFILRQTSGLISVKNRGISVDWGVFSIVFLSFIALAVFLWMFSLKISGDLLTPYTKVEEPPSITRSWAETVAFRILGLYLLSYAIPRIFYWSTFIHLSKKMNPGTFEPTPEHVSFLVGPIVELIFSLWLIFGAKGLRGLMTLARNTGQSTQ